MKLKIIGGICLVIFAMIYSCQSDSSIEFDRYFSSGRLVYQNHCQNCHSAKGEGLAALIPALSDSIFLRSNRKNLVCIVNNGTKDKLTVAGKAFENQMPAAGLTPIEVAQVLTYITNSFGNKQGIYPVDDVNTQLTNCR